MALGEVSQEGTPSGFNKFPLYDSVELRGTN